MEDAKSAAKSTASLDDYEHDMCCCCVCQCTTKKTRGLTCCWIFPIKCGIIIIGILTILLTALFFTELMYTLLQDDEDWWYVAVALAAWVMMFLATTYFITFFMSDNDDSRSRLWLGCQFIIIGVTLIAAWNVVYYYYWYRAPNVYTGTADTGYIKQTKKQYIVWSLFVAAVVDAFYAYFICICRSYQRRMAPPKEKSKKEDKPAMMEDKKEEGMNMDEEAAKPEGE